MVVDYTNLELIRKDIAQDILLNRSEKTKLNEIMANITEIEKTQDPAFPDDETKKIIPKDTNLGADITDARSQEIYDKIVADHATL